MKVTGFTIYWAVYFAILSFIIALFLIPALTDDTWTDKDMRQACAKHGGVRAFEANSSILTAAKQDKSVVICIDGYVTKDQP